MCRATPENPSSKDAATFLPCIDRHTQPTSPPSPPSTHTVVAALPVHLFHRATPNNKHTSTGAPVDTRRVKPFNHRRSLLPLRRDAPPGTTTECCCRKTTIKRKVVAVRKEWRERETVARNLITTVTPPELRCCCGLLWLAGISTHKGLWGRATANKTGKWCSTWVGFHRKVGLPECWNPWSEAPGSEVAR